MSMILPFSSFVTKEYITEGFMNSPAAMEKVRKQIFAVLKKSVKGLVSVPGDFERFHKKKDPRAYIGLNFFFGSPLKKFRINWYLKNYNSRFPGSPEPDEKTEFTHEPHSIDFWWTPKAQNWYQSHQTPPPPDFAANIEGMNFQQILKAVLPIILKKQNAKIEYFIPASTSAMESEELDYEKYLTEMASIPSEEMLRKIVSWMITNNAHHSKGQKKVTPAAFKEVDIGRMFATPQKPIAMVRDLAKHYPALIKTTMVGSRPQYLYVGPTDVDQTLKKIKIENVAPMSIRLSPAVADAIKEESDRPKNTKPYKETLEHIRKLIPVVARGGANLMVLYGPGGTSKTVIIEKTLSDIGYKEWTDASGVPPAGSKVYFRISGSISPIELYKKLFALNGNIIFIDDADKIFENEEGLNMLKSATDTRAHRWVSWIKANMGADTSGIPQSFEFTGRIFTNTNLPLHKIDEQGALQTRGFAIPVFPTPGEMYEHIKTILNELVPAELTGEKPINVPLKKRQQILEKIKDMPGLNIRRMVRAITLVGMGVTEWKDMISWG